MKNIFSRMPKKLLAAVALVTAVIGTGVAVQAWGPNRTTYTMNNPAPQAEFNSITDNPDYGDERTFYTVKEKNEVDGGYDNKMNVQDGQRLMIRMYVHNDASEALNTVPDGNGGFKGIATGVKARIHLPTATEKVMRSNAYISANNTITREINDTIELTSDSPYKLSYIPGSAKQYTQSGEVINPATGQRAVKTLALSDSIVTTGAPIGFEQADGVIPGCMKYTSYVTIEVEVDVPPTPSYQIEKSVRLEGQGSEDWKQTVTAQPSQVVEYKLLYTNGANSTLMNDVLISDKLPAGFKAVPGSVKLYNSNNPVSGGGYQFPDTAIQRDGSEVYAQIGDYTPGASGTLVFKAKAPALTELACETTIYRNIGYATPDGSGTVSDDANVEIVNPDDCEEPTPTYDCTALTLTRLGGRKVRINVVTSTTGGATLRDVTYNFGDGTTKLSNSTTEEYEFAADGNYVVRAVVRFNVNGEVKEVNADKCAAPITFKTEAKCPVPGKEHLPANSPDCKEPTTTPTVTTIPNTGAGNMIGLFAVVTILGAIVRRALFIRSV